MLKLAHHILLVCRCCSWADHQACVSKVMLMDLVIAMEGSNCTNSDRVLDVGVHHLRLLLSLFGIDSALLIS
jgi:hypothetical protein